MSAYCLHRLQRLAVPVKSAKVNGRPWRYRCVRCRLRFKVATGVVIPGLYHEEVAS